MQPHKHIHVPDECPIAFICCHFSRKHFFWRDWHPSAALPKVTEGSLCCASAALPHHLFPLTLCMFVSSKRNPINTKQSVKPCKEERFPQNFLRNIVQYSALFTARHHRSCLSRGKSAWDPSDKWNRRLFRCGRISCSEVALHRACWCARVHIVTSHDCRSLYWECCAEIVSVYNLKVRALQKEPLSLCCVPFFFLRCRSFRVEALRSVWFWYFLPPTPPSSPPTTISSRDSVLSADQ